MAAKNEIFFRKLFDETHGKAFNFLKALSRDENVAREITQTSFIKIWKHIDKFKDHPNPKALVYVTVKNTFLDEMRKQNRLNALLTSMEENEHLHHTIADTSGDSPVAGEAFAAVHSAIKKLPEHIQRIYTLYQFEELSPVEIADTLQLSVTTIRTNIETAKLFLRRELKKFRN
ncbi:RNA polymerase sigma factor [Sinomicrobium weinanense]|uniref:RNA polymerase sigma factor n=1 Tax=Sinomicrobium weinanense TaxID=2842200 RepID=A0A926JTT5_9FLAO|nr:RNA polymerase sigma factor [Sinomicrobium weinanense]MBC9797189.1 RNA polymerase sigma factor [Sinomicrobium weinanense]MBU3122747.1 RNA polymerase sigma factor [Sinomicrobium weinanense]